MKRTFVLTLLGIALLINTVPQIYASEQTQQVANSKEATRNNECPQLGREYIGFSFPLIMAIGTKLVTSSTEAAAVTACLSMAYLHLTSVVLPALHHAPIFKESTILKNIHDEMNNPDAEIQSEAVAFTTITAPLVVLAITAELLYKAATKAKSIVLPAISQ